MQQKRIIPVLLLHKGGLVKSVQFKNYQYVGDPINALRIFNEKEVDEIVILDIDPTRQERGPNFEQIKEVASEAFIPVAYGGGVRYINHVEKLFNIGVEKVVLNTHAVLHPSLITEAANLAGRQSIVVAVDVRKSMFGKYQVFYNNGSAKAKDDPVTFVKRMEEYGAGEILLNSIDRDGTYKGYDIALIKEVSTAVNIPVIACGGAGSLEDFKKAIREGYASAVAAGSMFVFQRPHQAVLISYPSQIEIKNVFNEL